MCVCVCAVSHIRFLTILWTTNCQAPLSIGFHWSWWPFPSPGVLPYPGIELTSPALVGAFFTSGPLGKSRRVFTFPYFCTHNLEIRLWEVVTKEWFHCDFSLDPMRFANGCDTSRWFNQPKLRLCYLSVNSVQSLSHVRLFATPWTAIWQSSLSITNSQGLLKLMSVWLVLPLHGNKSSAQLMLLSFKCGSMFKIYYRMHTLYAFAITIISRIMGIITSTCLKLTRDFLELKNNGLATEVFMFWGSSHFIIV